MRSSMSPTISYFWAEPAYQNAIHLLQNADCLIIGGTSLEVGSAASLAHSYHGKYLIIINKGNRDNIHALQMYQSKGFAKTGEVDEDEIFLALNIGI